MNKKLNLASPFLILLIPALIVAGFTSLDNASDEMIEERAKVINCLEMPKLTGLIKAIF